MFNDTYGWMGYGYFSETNILLRILVYSFAYIHILLRTHYKVKNKKQMYEMIYVYKK